MLLLLEAFATACLLALVGLDVVELRHVILPLLLLFKRNVTDVTRLLSLLFEVADEADELLLRLEVEEPIHDLVY
jgi:hypothetical protein